MISFFYVSLQAYKYCLYRSNSNQCNGKYDFVISEFDLEAKYVLNISRNNYEQFSYIYISEDLKKPLNLSNFISSNVIVEGIEDHPSVQLVSLPTTVKLLSLQISNHELTGNYLELKNVNLFPKSKIRATHIHADPRQLSNTKVITNTFDIENTSQINSKVNFDISELRIHNSGDVILAKNLYANGAKLPKAESYSFFEVKNLSIKKDQNNRSINIHFDPSFDENYNYNLEGSSIRIISRSQKQTIEEITGNFESEYTEIYVKRINDATINLKNGGVIYVNETVKGKITCNGLIILKQCEINSSVELHGHLVILNQISFNAYGYIECDKLTFGSYMNKIITETAKLCINATEYILSADTIVPYLQGYDRYLEILQLMNGPEVKENQTVIIKVKSNIPSSILSSSIDTNGKSRLEVSAKDGTFYLVPGIEFDNEVPFYKNSIDKFAAILLVVVSALYVVLLCTTNCCDCCASNRDVRQHVDIPARKATMREKLMENILKDYCMTGPLDLDSSYKRYENVRQWQELHKSNLKDIGASKNMYTESMVEKCLAQSIEKAINMKKEIKKLGIVTNDRLGKIQSSEVLDRIYQDSNVINDSLSMENLIELCDLCEKNTFYFQPESLIRASYNTYRLEFEGYKQYPGSEQGKQKTVYIPLSGFVNKSDLQTNMLLGIPDYISLDTVRTFTILYVFYQKKVREIRKMTFDSVKDIRRDFPWNDMGDAKHVVICPATSLPCLLDERNDLENTLNEFDDNFDASERRTINCSQYYIDFVIECDFFPTWQQLVSYIYLKIIIGNSKSSLGSRIPTLPRKIVEHAAYIVQDYNRMLRVYYYDYGIFNKQFLYSNIEIMKDIPSDQIKKYNSVMEQFKEFAMESQNAIVRYQRELMMCTDSKPTGILEKFFKNTFKSNPEMFTDSFIASSIGQARDLDANIIRKAFKGTLIDDEPLMTFVPFIMRNTILTKLNDKARFGVGKDNANLFDRVMYLSCLNLCGRYWTPPPTSPDKLTPNKVSCYERNIILNTFIEYIEIMEFVPDDPNDFAKELLKHAWYNYFNFRTFPMGTRMKYMFRHLAENYNPAILKNGRSYYTNEISNFLSFYPESDIWNEIYNDIDFYQNLKKNILEGKNNEEEVDINQRAKALYEDLNSSEGKKVQEKGLQRIYDDLLNFAKEKHIGHNILLYTAKVYFKTIKVSGRSKYSRIPVYDVKRDPNEKKKEALEDLTTLIKRADKDTQNDFNVKISMFRELHPEDAGAMVYAYLTQTNRPDIARVWLRRHYIDYKDNYIFKPQTIKINTYTFCPDFEVHGNAIVNPYKNIDIFSAYRAVAKNHIDNKNPEFPNNPEEILVQLFLMNLPNVLSPDITGKIVLLPSNIVNLINSVIFGYEKALANKHVSVSEFYKTSTEALENPWKRIC